MFDRVATGMTEALAEMARYEESEPGFAPIAAEMRTQWLAGMAGSLRIDA